MAHPESIPPRWHPARNGKWLLAPQLASVPGLVHGFTFRSAGDASDPGFAARLQTSTGARELRLLRQVHGSRVAPPGAGPPPPEADGWAGRPGPGVLLGLLTADCLPVLLCHPASATLGLAHAGWRGAIGGVALRALEAMGVPPGEVLAALGPSIGPCCYQTGEDVARAAGKRSPHLTPWGTPGKYRMDLPGLVKSQLLAAGIREDHMEVCGQCTACRPEDYFSYRREGSTGRLCAFAGWAAEPVGPSLGEAGEGRFIALTGGIATGKSTAARLFAEQGARVIDADWVARRVVEPGSAGLEEIRRTFGEWVIGPDGTLDRKALGDHIFRDPAAREQLNRIVHPRVAREVRREVERIRGEEPEALVVYDVPLLFEVEMEHHFDLVVVVYAPPEEQRRRLAARDRLGPEEVEARIASQMAIEEKARRAQVVLDNRGSVDDLRRQVADVVRRLRSRCAGGENTPTALKC